MHFASIYFLIFIPVVVYLLWRKKTTSPIKVSSKKLFKSGATKLSFTHKLGKYLITLAFVLFIIALARPQTEVSKDPTTEEGIDIALVLDVSGSMESVDFKPNRLEVAKDTIQKFVKERSGDRMSLVIFAGAAYTKIPLTLDNQVLLQSLSEVSVKSVKEQGTAIGMAMSVGINRLKKSEASSKVIILVTDGDNNAGAISPETASNLADDLNIKVYTIGVGTDKTILPYESFGKTMYQQIEGGLNEELLKNIAQSTEGEYFRAKDAKSLGSIFEEINSLETTEFDDLNYKEYQEWAFLFIQSGFACLFVGIVFDKYLFIQIP
jgi:Ca-activated chloride channel family protein